MKNLRLLIVDDSALMATHLAKILMEIDGIEIIGVAFNVADALRYIESVMPDLTILDLLLSDGNGMDILKRIKGSGATAKVAMYTYYPFPQYERRCRRLGADYFFDKYTDFKKLLDIVKKMAKERVESSDPNRSE